MATQNFFQPKTATVAVSAAGNTQLVAGSAGFIYTVIGYEAQATSNVATTGGAVITVDLRDGATTSLNCQRVFFAPGTAVTTGGANPLTSSWMSPSHGAVRTSAGNALNVNLSAALTSGVVQVTVSYITEPA